MATDAVPRGPESCAWADACQSRGILPSSYPPDTAKALTAGDGTVVILKAALMMAMLAGGAAHAADRIVVLTRPAPLARFIAAMPRIGHPRDAAERQINLAMDRRDAAGRRAAAACRGKGQGWERTTRVTMRGPGYLSYEVADAFDCGGVHPDNSTDTVVYDLRTGRPVDWTMLLPPALTGTVSLKPGVDGTRTVSLGSAALRQRFLAAQTPQANPDDAKQCAEVLAFAVPTGLRVWLDGPAGALAVQPNMPHGSDSCAQPLLLSAAELRQLGAAPALADALDAARDKLRHRLTPCHDAETVGPLR